MPRLQAEIRTWFGSHKLLRVYGGERRTMYCMEATVFDAVWNLNYAHESLCGAAATG